MLNKLITIADILILTDFHKMIYRILNILLPLILQGVLWTLTLGASPVQDKVVQFVRPTQRPSWDAGIVGLVHTELNCKYLLHKVAELVAI